MNLALNWIDITIIGIIVLSALVGLLRGLVKEGLTLLSWLFAFGLSITFGPEVSTYLISYFASASLRHAISFISIFLGVLVLGSILSFFLKKLVDSTGLLLGDRFLGFFFGILRGIVLITLFLLIGVMTDMPHHVSWQESQFIPVFKPLVAWVKDLLPDPVNHYFANESDSTAQAPIDSESLQTEKGK
jgi:membrane protein required for colicin V production